MDSGLVATETNAPARGVTNPIRDQKSMSLALFGGVIHKGDYFAWRYWVDWSLNRPPCPFAYGLIAPNGYTTRHKTVFGS